MAAVQVTMAAVLVTMFTPWLQYIACIYRKFPGIHGFLLQSVNLFQEFSSRGEGTDMAFLETSSGEVYMD